MTARECVFEGCGRKRHGFGLCSAHQWQRKKGHELRPIRPIRNRRASLARDDLGRKECMGCRQWYPEGDYPKLAASYDGLYHRCKRCRTLQKFNITAADFDRMLEAQGNACAICLSPESGHVGWSVDHDHSCCSPQKSCGKCVRGLLCFSCNIGLGHFRDDVAVIESAIAYLERAV